jgi:hypothetical protein
MPHQTPTKRRKKSFVDVQCSTESPTDATSRANADEVDSKFLSLPEVESRNGDELITGSYLTSTMAIGALRVGVDAASRSTVHDSACNTDPVRVLPPEEANAGSSTDIPRWATCPADVRDFECNVRIVASSRDVACVTDDDCVTAERETRDSASRSEHDTNPGETRRQLVDAACGDDVALSSRPDVIDAACGTEALELAHLENIVAASKEATTEATRSAAPQPVIKLAAVKDASCLADITVRSPVRETASMTDPDRCTVCSSARWPLQPPPREPDAGPVPPVPGNVSVGCMTDVGRTKEVACGTDEESGVRSDLPPSAGLSTDQLSHSSPLRPQSSLPVDELTTKESVSGQETTFAEANGAANVLQQQQQQQQQQRDTRALSWSISQKTTVGTSKIPTRRRPLRKCDAECNTVIVIAPRATVTTVSETLLSGSERSEGVEQATKTDESSRVSTTSRQQERSNDDGIASGVQQLAAAADREEASVSAALVMTTPTIDFERVARPVTVDAACNTDSAPEVGGRAAESASSCRRGGRTVAGSGVLRAVKPQVPIVRKRPMRDASCTADIGISSLAAATPSPATVDSTQFMFCRCTVTVTFEDDADVKRRMRHRRRVLFAIHQRPFGNRLARHNHHSDRALGVAIVIQDVISGRRRCHRHGQRPTITTSALPRSGRRPRRGLQHQTNDAKPITGTHDIAILRARFVVFSAARIHLRGRVRSGLGRRGTGGNRSGGGKLSIPSRRVERRKPERVDFDCRRAGRQSQLSIRRRLCDLRRRRRVGQVAGEFAVQSQ